MRKAGAIAIFYTAIFDVAGDIFAKVVEAVIFEKDATDADGFEIVFEAVAAGFVFDIGMDVGIIPKNSWFDSLFSKRVDAID